jgi:hypothetical protein
VRYLGQQLEAIPEHSAGLWDGWFGNRRRVVASVTRRF